MIVFSLFNFLLWSILAEASINPTSINYQSSILQNNQAEKPRFERAVIDTCRPSCFLGHNSHLFCSHKHKKSYMVDTKLRSNEEARDFCQSWSNTSRLISVDNFEEYTTFLSLFYEVNSVKFLSPRREFNFLLPNLVNIFWGSDLHHILERFLVCERLSTFYALDSNTWSDINVPTAYSICQCDDCDQCTSNDATDETSESHFNVDQRSMKISQCIIHSAVSDKYILTKINKEAELRFNKSNDLAKALLEQVLSVNFTVNEKNYNTIVSITPKLAINLEKEIKTKSKKERIAKRIEFIKTMIDVFSYVLMKKPLQMLLTGSVISLTNNMSSYLACDSNDDTPNSIDNNDILIQALRFKNTTIDYKFVFPFNTSRYAQLASLTFPSGLDFVSIQTSSECAKPVAYGLIQTNLIHEAITVGYDSIISNSVIISFSLNHPIDHIKVLITFSHIRTVERGDKIMCVYWDHHNSIWNDSGCTLISSKSTRRLSVCKCKHLSTFTILLDTSKREKKNYFKEILMYLSNASSIVLLTTTIVVFLNVPVRHYTHRHTAIINVCFCLLISNILLIFIEHTQNTTICRFISGLLLYTLGSTLLWMLLQGYLLYRMVNEAMDKVNRLSKIYFYLIIYGSALLWPVLTLTLIGSSGLYEESSYYCWSSNSLHFHRIWTFTGPSLFLLLLNYLIYIRFNQKVKKSKENNSNYDEVKVSKLKKWRLRWSGLIILIILTWTFGLLSFHINGNHFLYIFIIFNSLQAIFIFTFEVVTKVFKLFLFKSLRSLPQPLQQPSSDGIVSCLSYWSDHDT